jgi:hypothetical protein
MTVEMVAIPFSFAQFRDISPPVGDCFRCETQFRKNSREKGGLQGRKLGLDRSKTEVLLTIIWAVDPRHTIVHAAQNDMARSGSISGLGLL